MRPAIKLWTRTLAAGKRGMWVAAMMAVAGAWTGCETSGTPAREKGPSGTVAYEILVEASAEGARIEVNGEQVGKTPATIKVFGDRDGTFHDFGSAEYVIRVFPVKSGQRIQTKVFRTGRWFSEEDRIPKHLFFDLDHGPEGFSVDLPPSPSRP